MTRAQEAEENYLIKRELATVRQRSEEASTQLEQAQGAIRELQQQRQPAGGVRSQEALRGARLLRTAAGHRRGRRSHPFPFPTTRTSPPSPSSSCLSRCSSPDAAAHDAGSTSRSTVLRLPLLLPASTRCHPSPVAPAPSVLCLRFRPFFVRIQAGGLTIKPLFSCLKRSLQTGTLWARRGRCTMSVCNSP